MYALLVQRDGEKCAHCGKVPTPKTRSRGNRLEIDHLVLPDGANDALGDINNCRLLCGRCNARLSYQARGGIIPGTGVPYIPTPTHSPSHSLNAPAKPYVDDTDGIRNDDTPPSGDGNTERAGISGGADSGPAMDATTAVRQEIDYTRAPAQMQANHTYEPAARLFALDWVRRARVVDYRELRAVVAERVGCSVQTADDYLVKMCSPVGPLERIRVSSIWTVQMRNGRH